MRRLTVLNSKLGFAGDAGRVRAVSSKIAKKLALARPTDGERIAELTVEELQDLGKVVGIADFMMHKYADKKAMRSILRHFVSIISDTAESLGSLEDEVSELILSAEDSVDRVKDIRVHVSDKSEIRREYSRVPVHSAHETSAINLTNFATEINPPEYQQNPQEQTA